VPFWWIKANETYTPVFLKLWPASGFRRKSNAKIVSDTERMKNTPSHVWAKTTFVDWPSTESMQISFFHKFLFLNNYFRKCFKLVYRKNVATVTLTTNSFPLFTCLQLWVCEILRKWSVCAPITYKEVSDRRKFEKHWYTQ
jgi:hypothetical protein